MPIGKALLLKGLGGLAAIGGTIGGGCYIYDHFSNQDTKFDRGLIEFLEAGGKIQFSVKDGNDSDISTTFPEFSSATPPTATATIKVSVGTATGGTTDGTLTDKESAGDGALGTKKYLQNLNKGSGNTVKAWTWECKIVFKKTETATGTELKDKEKLVQSSEPKGFFNELKDADTNNKHKELKIKFVKDCATNRGIAENKKINKLGNLASTAPTNNKIESTKTFELIDNSETTNKKLIPKDQSDFNSWFGITSN